MYFFTLPLKFLTKKSHTYMKTKSLLFLLLIFSNCIYSQIDFEPPITAVSQDEYILSYHGLLNADINNDSFDELIIASYDNIVWYKNINGNLQQERIHKIANSATARNIYATDINNDGFIDIIAPQRFEDKILVYKNLGDETFSPILIAEDIGLSWSLAFPDINNDGFKDILSGNYNSQTVSYILNNGDDTFSENTIVITNDDDIRDVKVIDANNDGHFDIFYVADDGELSYAINSGDNTFENVTYIGYCSSTSCMFDFCDINNDLLPDLIFLNSNENVSYKYNTGISFSNTTSLNSVIASKYLLVKDIDEDGLADLLTIQSPGSIVWYKHAGESFEFLPNLLITTNTLQKAILYNDFNNDGLYEIISCFSNTNDGTLSLFSKQTISSPYTEKILNRSISATYAVRIADMNNDGLKDIVSGYRFIVWNKNMGEGKFSSFLSVTNETSTEFARNLEIADMNNDGLLDIISTAPSIMEFYQNLGNEKFSLVYSLPLDIYSRDLEIADIDNDNDPDIILTFISGDTRLAIIKNLGNFTFSSMQPVIFTNYEYKPNKIKTGDIDNDGDIDIAVSSYDTSHIQWLENNGTGGFAYHEIGNIQTNAIDMADINNDGYLDIISAEEDNYNPGIVYWLLNNNGTFEGGLGLIDSEQSLKGLTCGDINNDGNIDIIGVSYEFYAPYEEKLICYSNNSNASSFEKIIINNGGSASGMERDVTIGDLNNDGKLDIAENYYFTGKTLYYINASTLAIEETEHQTSFKIYPNPFTSIIYWFEKGNHTLELYDIQGKIILRQKEYSETFLDLNFLEKGIYFLKFTNGQKSFTKKIIKK